MVVSIESPWDDTKQVAVVRSKGGVYALLDYSDQLLRCPSEPWPPAAIAPKLKPSEHAIDYHESERPALAQKLGFYTDLQSVHSEDALTWNLFGTLSADQSACRRFCNRLIRHLDRSAPENDHCRVSLWRRIPHPETLGAGGPEIDFLIEGDKCVVLGEAKWASREGRGQGIGGNKTQLGLRAELVNGLGQRIYPGRRLLLAYVTRETAEILAWASVKHVTWTELCSWPEHPFQDRLQQYLLWKAKHSSGAGTR